MPMQLRKRSAWRLEDVRAHDAIGQLERVAGGPNASADLGVFTRLVQIDAVDVRPEVAEADVRRLAPALEHADFDLRIEVVLFLRKTIGEPEIVVEDEL